MSFKPDDKSHEEYMEQLAEESARWLKVIAHILGQMQNLDENDIHEDIE